MVRWKAFALQSMLALVAAAHWAQSVLAQQCARPAHPYFDFQVDRAAEVVADSTRSPRPVGASEQRGPHRVVVQFTVDSLGVPDSTSFKVLLNSDDELAEATRRAFTRWRFRPAQLAGCRVPQLFQTPVRR